MKKSPGPPTSDLPEAFCYRSAGNSFFGKREDTEVKRSTTSPLQGVLYSVTDTLGSYTHTIASFHMFPEHKSHRSLKRSWRNLLHDRSRPCLSSRSSRSSSSSSSGGGICSSQRSLCSSIRHGGTQPAVVSVDVALVQQL